MTGHADPQPGPVWMLGTCSQCTDKKGLNECLLSRRLLFTPISVYSLIADNVQPVRACRLQAGTDWLLCTLLYK